MSNSCRDSNLNVIFTGEGILYQAHEVSVRIAEGVSRLLKEGGAPSADVCGNGSEGDRTEPVPAGERR